MILIYGFARLVYASRYFIYGTNTHRIDCNFSLNKYCDLDDTGITGYNYMEANVNGEMDYGCDNSKWNILNMITAGWGHISNVYVIMLSL